ncbi:MAG: hypothetical protein ACRDRK_21340 [Pseudonocardia sp.]
MTGNTVPAFFVGGGPLAGHGSVQTLPDGQPQPQLRVLLTQGPLIRLAGATEPLPRARRYGIYLLSDGPGDGSLIYEFVGEEAE